jgi:bacillithiol biosynthesis cysteine-adding enzyme BshC
METACIRHTEIPHTSRLFTDFQYHFDRVAQYYAHPPGDAASYAVVARDMQYPAERRAALVAALKIRNPGNPSLELLAQPGTVAVVTGQQVGLFSGPAYTIYKALTAARLAAHLNARGIPAVPVFWIATEDHDFAEVNHVFVFDTNHRPIKLIVNGSNDDGRPVGRIPIAEPPLGRLREALSGFPFSAETMDMVAESYRPGATFGTAFQGLLQRLLSNQGLLFVDPLDEPIRRMAAPLLQDVVRDGAGLQNELLQRSKVLAAAGYHAQVHIEPKTSLTFLLDGDRRITLRRQNGDYASKDRRYSVDELMERAEQLSPNALLRPVVQDYVLPTVAYVGGPAELAYMAQSQVLYEGLLGRMPVMLARAAFTVLDTRTEKLMERYGLALPSFFHGEDAIREKIAGQLIPNALVRAFDETQKTISETLSRFRDDLVSFDATLAAAADKSRAKMLYQLSKMERKTAREALKRNQRAGEEASYMSGLIFPEKHLQERLYSILPFIAQHGPALIDTLCEHVHLDCPDHKVLVA